MAQMHGHAAVGQRLLDPGRKLAVRGVPHHEVELATMALNDVSEPPGRIDLGLPLQQHGTDFEQHRKPRLNVEAENHFGLVGTDDLSHDFATAPVEEADGQPLVGPALAGQLDLARQLLADLSPVPIER